VHDAKDPSFDLPPMFNQVISTLFYLMNRYEKVWKNVDGSEAVPHLGTATNNHRCEAVPVTRSKLVAEFVEGCDHFCGLYKTVLAHENYAQLKRIIRKAKTSAKVNIPHDLWAKILYDFAFTYQSWNRNRRRLVGIMTPLYFGRLAGYTYEVEDMDSEKAEEVIQEQATVFEKNKEYLRHRFTEWEE